MRLQPPCASLWMLTVTNVVSRDRKLRVARVLCVGRASATRLTGTLAKRLTKSILTSQSTRVVGPHSVDFVLVSKRLNAWFNVDVLPCPAHGS